MVPVKKITACRVCKATKFQKILTLGPTPLANAFLTEDQINLPENFYPLDVYFCLKCSFIQLGHVVNPKILFDNYVYASSTSPVFVNHFKTFAASASEKYLSNKKELIIDIGSNDGILLEPFKALGFKVLGIEPAATVASLARKKKIPTIEKYFSRALAKAIVKEHGKAKIVTATNVFAHIDDLDEVIDGLKTILDDDGMFVIEAPYLIDFLENRYFDLVYHEHLSYWSIDALKKLFKRHNMEVFDVEKVPVHGGSIRVYVKKKQGVYPINKSVGEFLDKEKKANIFSLETYQEFAKKIQENKITLLTLLGKLKLQGKTIAAYGAPAKGNTLLNYFSIGTDVLDFVVDDSPLKQGLFTPGKHIPVVSSKVLYKEQPDYLFILAWNFAEPIMKNNSKYKDKGGTFIIPVPKPKIVK